MARAVGRGEDDATAHRVLDHSRIMALHWSLIRVSSECPGHEATNLTVMNRSNHWSTGERFPGTHSVVRCPNRRHCCPAATLVSRLNAHTVPETLPPEPLGLCKRVQQGVVIH
jgi:hypothetical protein